MSEREAILQTIKALTSAFKKATEDLDRACEGVRFAISQAEKRFSDDRRRRQDLEFPPTGDLQALRVYVDSASVEVFDRLGEYAIARTVSGDHIAVTHMPTGIVMHRVSTRAEADAVMATAHKMLPTFARLSDIPLDESKRIAEALSAVAAKYTRGDL